MPLSKVKVLVKKKLVIPGINIQAPWAELIAMGEKTVETRQYPLPEKFKGKAMALIETPGKSRSAKLQKQSSRIIAVVTFSESFRYASHREWVRDFQRHRVPHNHPHFKFTAQRPRWGWVVASVQMLTPPQSPPKKRGILYAARCAVEL